MKLIYVAAALSTPDKVERKLHVQAARHAGFKIAKLGFYPVMPTVNTDGFENIRDSDFWYDATLELMRRCDAVYVVDGWQDSKGVIGEIAEAIKLKIPRYYDFNDLIDGEKHE
jgi:hypothetical protein